MIPDKIIYTDGHDVTVTESTLQVKNTVYKLNGVIKHGLLHLHGERLPGIILLVLGALIAVVGLLNLIPATALAAAEINGNFYSANTIAVWIGAFLALIGLAVIALVRDRYAVRISTAEGEKNAVVSNKKEYIAQIINALNKAFDTIRTESGPYITVKD